jgi:hypothetical protein
MDNSRSWATAGLAAMASVASRAMYFMIDLSNLAFVFPQHVH